MFLHPPAEVIKRIVCSGGGAKGIVYVGAYEALLDSGVIHEVQEIAGASIGAITAAFMALGISREELRKLTFNMEFAGLMGEKARGKKQGVSFITRDGKALEDFLRSNILKIIQQKLQTLDSPDQRFLQLRNKINATIEPVITFSDLALLNELFPTQFKKLVLNAVDFHTGETQIFDAQKTPEVEIARSCRASASLPIILEPVTIIINGKVRVLVDGGLSDNLPTDYFDDEVKAESAATKNSIPAQTLVFAFGEGLDNTKNPVFKALYGTNQTIYQPSRFESFKRDYLVKSLGKVKTPYKNTAQKEIGYQKLRADYALRTVELRVGNLTTQDFNKARQTARVMAALGYLDTINYVINHDLQKADFNADAFYQQLVNHFTHIYSAVLADQAEDKNPLLKKIKDLCRRYENRESKTDNLDREILYLIKDDVEIHTTSHAAFALSRALEFTTHQIDSDNLFKETYEHVNAKKWLLLRPKSAPYETLGEGSRISLFKQKCPETNARAHKIFDRLCQIEEFNAAVIAEPTVASVVSVARM